MDNDIIVKLEVFEKGLWESYLEVKNEENTLWVSLHKVADKVGMSLELFNERLNQLWLCQFSSNPIYKNKYEFGLEVDATPIERYRLRNKLIIIENCPMFLIQMNIKDNKE